MKKMLILLIISTMLSVVTPPFCFAKTKQRDSEIQMSSPDKIKTEKDPWIGQYCMSIFTKTRSSKTVGKDHLSVALKVQHFDWDQVKRTGGGGLKTIISPSEFPSGLTISIPARQTIARD